MAVSAVPGAIDALLAILRAAPGLQGVQVLDGPPTGDQSAKDYVAVGYQPETDEAVQITQSFAYAGARTRDEQAVVLGWIDTWTGDRDMHARRTRAFELLGVIELAIRASGGSPDAPTLNGSVLWSEFTAGVLKQANTDQGVRAGIAWSIALRARI
ncbi:hypothetical protein [Streptomyces sp. NPDC008141]|uniref:hypothetical protein n=1 Tax=Streptomyces sp. NPDC008141 TaxID=3364815 RepID=UPI0036F0C09D